MINFYGKHPHIPTSKIIKHIDYKHTCKICVTAIQIPNKVYKFYEHIQLFAQCNKKAF